MKIQIDNSETETGINFPQLELEKDYLIFQHGMKFRFRYIGRGKVFKEHHQRVFQSYYHFIRGFPSNQNPRCIQSLLIELCNLKATSEEIILGAPESYSLAVFYRHNPCRETFQRMERLLQGGQR